MIAIMAFVLGSFGTSALAASESVADNGVAVGTIGIADVLKNKRVERVLNQAIETGIRLGNKLETATVQGDTAKADRLIMKVGKVAVQFGEKGFKAGTAAIADLAKGQ